MSRHMRIELPGVVCRVTPRCNRREPICRNDENRTVQLDIVCVAMDRFDAQILACCRMGNHHQLVLDTRRAKLRS